MQQISLDLIFEKLDLSYPKKEFHLAIIGMFLTIVLLPCHKFRLQSKPLLHLLLLILSLIAISERLNIEAIATLDKDFDIYRRYRNQPFIRVFYPQ